VTAPGCPSVVAHVRVSLPTKGVATLVSEKPSAQKPICTDSNRRNAERPTQTVTPQHDLARCWAVLCRPIEAQPHYGRHLGDPAYWAPYVREVLVREGLPIARLKPGFVGTFPTFLTGDVVVKLLGSSFDGAQSWAAEVAMHRLLSENRAVPAPLILASGQLWEDEPAWRYIVTERLTGVPVRELQLSGLEPSRVEAEDLASHLGVVVARLHHLAPPAEVARRQLLGRLRQEAPLRLRNFGLPDRLVEQVPDYLSDTDGSQVLVHADITEDHVFVAEDRLEGIIDWGDAFVADRYYELAATYLDALRSNPLLLKRFLDGYGWDIKPSFPRRALQGILEFQFNAIDRLRLLVDLGGVATLDDLAARLFEPVVG
jgi:hygromycin-B 7''-O-kinase